MQLIAVDIGNSFTKIGVSRSADCSPFGGDWSTVKLRLQNDRPLVLDSTELKLSGDPALWAVSSVNSLRAEELDAWISKHRSGDHFHLISESDVDLRSDVQSRKQLGRDRLVAAWMAVELNDGAGPVIVVDAGTAVTIDLVDRELTFQGGYIFPGADSNFRQLVQNTDALPPLSQTQKSKLLGGLDYGSVGKSTEQAIFNGVYQSQIGGIIGIVAAMSRKISGEPTIYLTGGGIEEISSFLPDSWIRVPDLVLRGAIGIGQQVS